MLILTTFDEVKVLNLPPSINHALQAELLAPFEGDETALIEFWQDSGSVVYVMTDDDGPNVINEQDTIANLRLTMAVDFPEYVMKFTAEDDAYYLALTIINDEGAGCYLLVNANHASDIPTKLQAHLL